MATLGSLVVTLEANVAKFESDLGKAVTMAEKSMTKISQSVSIARDAIETLIGAVGIQQMISFGASLVQASAHLQELSIMTGLTVPALSAMKNSAAGVGLGVDEAAASFDRMQRNAALALGGNRQQQATFDALGLSGKDLAAGLKDPQAMLLKIADAFGHMNDNGLKTNLMMATFNRGGAVMNSFLQEMVRNGYENATVTALQAERAQEYERKLANLKTSFEAFSSSVVFKVIPGLVLMMDSVRLAFERIWILIKSGFDIGVTWIDEKIRGLTERVAKGMMALSAKGSLVYEKGAEILANTAKQGLGDDTVAAKLAKQTEDLKKNADAMTKAFADYEKATSPSEHLTPEGVLDRYNRQKGMHDAPVVFKPPKLPVEHDVMAAQMAQQLKILSDAMKTEDAIAKLANTQLDADYKNGQLSLSKYSIDKQETLRKNAAVTQSLYASEIALVQTYVDAYTLEINKLEAKEKNHSATSQDLQRLATERKEKEAALAKSVDLNTAATDAGLKASGEQIALNEKLASSAQGNAQAILDTDIAYAIMIGDTEKASALQTTLAQRYARLTAEANGYLVTQQKLDALAKDAALRAAKDPLSGMQRSVMDYAKGLTDVAKATEAMTTKMLNGMEDALVAFVLTGKLSFKSLVDSMIADMVRMVVRQQIMGGIAMAFGALFGVPAAGGGAGGVGGGGLGGMTGRATGGAVNKGQTYTVGERGPEQFVPSVAGSIMPNGTAGGGTHVTYAPTIQIDSRSDRAQVQADTVATMRQGQKELVALLQRYNPSIRV